MRVLNPLLDLDRFFSRLRHARERMLMVDYDGTVAPFHPQPECAAPYPQVAKLLNEIGAMPSNRVIIISGRKLSDMQEPLSHFRIEEVWASHGWQRSMPQGPQIDFAPDPAVSLLLEHAEAHARRLHAFGARVERKPGSLAVHWRGLEASLIDAIRKPLGEAWAQYAGRGLEILPFEGGLELRSRERTKGDAVKTILSESPEGAMFAYLGDDKTDEDAFEAIAPHGLGILVRPDLRETHADLWLSPPRELIEFLERWHSCARLP